MQLKTTVEHKTLQCHVPPKNFIAGIIVVNLFFMNLHLMGAIHYQNSDLCWLDFSVAGRQSYYYQAWVLYGTLFYLIGFKIFGFYATWTWLGLATLKGRHEDASKHMSFEKLTKESKVSRPPSGYVRFPKPAIVLRLHVEIRVQQVI